MNTNTLKNLISLRKSITQRIKKTLQELTENLSHPQQSQAPVPIPIPIRNDRNASRLGRNYCRYYSTQTGFRNVHYKFQAFKFLNVKHCQAGKLGKIIETNSNWIRFNFQNSNFSQYRTFKTFNGSFLYNNFSQKSQFQFRNKLANSGIFRYNNGNSAAKNLSVNIRAFLQANKLDTSKNDKYRQGFVRKQLQPQVKSNIRLNISLTPKFSEITLQMAKTVSSAGQGESPYSAAPSNGSYVDFPMNNKFSIPSTTILNIEILDELILDLKILEAHIAELKLDLQNLFELGELPIKYLRETNTLRVFFPNCDKAKLEALLKEKDIRNGIIYEDFADIQSPSAPSVSETDILSSYYGSSSDSSCRYSTEYDDDVLSGSSSHHPLSNSGIIRIDTPSQHSQHSQQQVSFNESDVCWA